MKVCRVCKEEKEETEYYHVNRRGSNPEARHTECKKCAIKRIRASQSQTLERRRDRHYSRRYGISLERFEEMVLEQDGKCAICETTEPGGKHNQWAVDHDHESGDVRELLCKDCNIVLGLVEDSPEHLQRLIDYILKHNAKRV